jgi:hypothetical protein
MSKTSRPDVAVADGARFPAWVWQPRTLVRLRGLGYATSDIWITPGRIVTESRRHPLLGMRHQRIEYNWSTVVGETVTPYLFMPGLLVDIHGQLGKVVVSGRHRLRRALADAGFNVVDIKRLAWVEAPLPVPRQILGDHINEVPECVIAP